MEGNFFVAFIQPEFVSNSFSSLCRFHLDGRWHISNRGVQSLCFSCVLCIPPSGERSANTQRCRRLYVPGNVYTCIRVCVCVRNANLSRD